MSGSSHSGGSPLVPQKVLDIICGYKATQCLLTACELEIFDNLAGQPKSAKSLSQQLAINEDAASRLLDVLVSLELLKCRQNNKNERLYENSPYADCLMKTSPLNFVKRVNAIPAIGRPLFQSLTSAVREGTNQWQNVFNMPGKQVFEEMFESHDKLMAFLGMMKGHVAPVASIFVSCFQLNRFKRMCDLGGCTGDIAFAACKAYPDMKITVLDIPQVVNCSSQFVPSLNECPNQTNVSFVPGDFFKPTLPPADLYVLTNIIHDWGEEQIGILLSNIFNNLPSGGAILIGEDLLYDDKSGPLSAQYLSLEMLTNCYTGARQRSGAEFKQLLEKHGFQNVQIKITGTSIFDAVLAVKP